ncbi:penicillin-binding protein 2 [Clostridium carnis]
MKTKNKRKLLMIFFISTIAIFALGCSKVNKAQKAFDGYKEKWVAKDFKGMYEMISSDSRNYISEEDFISRYNNIYGAIEAKNITIENTENAEKLEDSIVIPFSLKLDTVAGNIELKDFKVSLIKEDKTFKIKWDESLIFPEMVKGDKVRVDSFRASRGKILDRNDNPLAQDGEIRVLGIHPLEFDKENKDAKITEIAKTLDISEDTIKEKLEANSNPDFFVHLVDILQGDERLKTLANREKEGILIKSKISRVYSGGEAFGRLIGYIGPITAEELEANSDKGYTDISLIGKAGLEQVYEGKLKGNDGGEIYIERGLDKISVAKKDAENGKDIKLSIDSELQNKIYSEMTGEKGAATAVNPKTGEVIALVSSPSYNSNVFTTYVTKTQKKIWEESNNADEINRFNKVYSPGSTMKLLTASIGLDNGNLNPSEARDIQGLSWQKDSSWGNYKITRVTDPGKAVNLRDAVNHSDNIYFGQVALEVGADKFINGIKGFGYGEELNFEYPMGQSQISNEGTIKGDIQLADTGYGQGELMVTPLNVALAYSALGNNGNIMKPRLVISENSEASIWKEKAIDPKNLPTLIGAFTALINDSDGTITDGKVQGITVAGKTGTAEIKKSQDDTNGTENGWFVSVNPEDSKISLAIMIENVKGRGGSHIPVGKVKNVMEYYLKR